MAWTSIMWGQGEVRLGELLGMGIIFGLVEPLVGWPPPRLPQVALHTPTPTAPTRNINAPDPPPHAPHPSLSPPTSPPDGAVRRPQLPATATRHRRRRQVRLAKRPRQPLRPGDLAVQQLRVPVPRLHLQKRLEGCHVLRVGLLGARCVLGGHPVLGATPSSSASSFH